MAIYNGTQNVNISGIGKVYVGSQLVYQKQDWHTIYTGSDTSTTYATLNYITSNSSAITDKDPFDSIADTTSPLKLRLTIKLENHGYTMSTAGRNYYQYYSLTSHQVNTTSSSAITVTVTLDDISWPRDSNTTLFRIRTYFNAGAVTNTTTLVRLSSDGTIDVYSANPDTSYYSRMWVTKVEQYY